MRPVIDVNNVRKEYPLYKKKSDKIKEALSITGRKYHIDFEALKDVSFSVEKGECVGIIGLNGAGKSTLLKILTGVIKPTSGNVSIQGKIAALLELGAGFNPEYTGLENIYLNTMLMGYSKEETDEKIDEILQFADIGKFIYQPVKVYSSGMFVRLAFAIAVTVDPDILIVDEALSVGDVFFQQKCYNVIREFAQRSTVLIVSHDLNSITKFCKRVLLLHNGVLISDGDAREAVSEYYKVKQGSVLNEGIKNQLTAEFTVDYLNRFIEPDKWQYSGRMDVVIERYYYQINGKPFAEYCEKGNILSIKLMVRTNERIENLIVGYQVLDKYGNEVFGETSITSGSEKTILEPGTSIISYHVKWPEVREGDYFITLGIGAGYDVLNQVEQCWINQAIHLINTTNGKLIYGLFNNPIEGFDIQKV